MLRAVVLALILVFAASPTVAADDEGGVVPAAWEGLALAHAAPPAGKQAAAVGRLPRLAWHARWVARPGQAVAARTGMLEPRQQQGLVLPWRSQGRSALALPLTDRLVLGVGYDRVLGEDLWREFAEIGARDYESHTVLLRAHWRF